MREGNHNTPGPRDALPSYSQSLGPEGVSTATDLIRVAGLRTVADRHHATSLAASARSGCHIFFCPFLGLLANAFE